MPIDYIALGATLRTAREAKGFRQKDVGKRLGMTGANVSLIEKGTVRTSLENLEAYANLVGCRITLVVARADDPRALTAARLVELLPTLEEPLYATLAAWVDLWEARAAAREGRSG